VGERDRKKLTECAPRRVKVEKGQVHLLGGGKKENTKNGQLHSSLGRKDKYEGPGFINGEIAVLFLAWENLPPVQTSRGRVKTSFASTMGENQGRNVGVRSKKNP